MAKTISELTALTGLGDADLFVTVDDTDSTTKKITAANIAVYLAALTQTLTNKTLTSPTINTPTLTGGTVNPTTLQKSSVNVPTISETATLTNKILGTIRTSSATATSSGNGGVNDNYDVSAIGILYADTGNDSAIVIGGLQGGVAGQVLFILKVDALQSVTIEHAEGVGTQNILTSNTNDISLTDYGGALLVCNGTSWFVVNH